LKPQCNHLTPVTDLWKTLSPRKPGGTHCLRRPSVCELPLRPYR
jgi:hypothetical protein